MTYNAVPRVDPVTKRLHPDIETSLTDAVVAPLVDDRVGRLRFDVTTQPGLAPEQALAAAPAGSIAVIPPGIYQPPTGTANGFKVTADDVTVEMAPGAEIQVPTWGQPGIDAIGRNGVKVLGGGLIRYTGTRGNHTGTIRGGATYTAGAGVYLSGDRCAVDGLRVIGMPTGVYLSSWDGSSLYGHRGKGNVIRGLETEGMNFGILYTAQDDLTLADIYGHDDVDDSGGANPTHVIYGSATASARARGITVSNLRARNLLFGQPYQFKYQDSGTMTGLVSADSRGILNLHGCSDLEVVGVVTTGTKELLGSPHGALTVQDTSTARVKVRNVTIVADSAGLNQRLLFMYSVDGVLENVQIISKRTSVDGVGIAQVIGDRMSARNITCIEQGSAGVGLLVGDIANSLTTNDVQVEGLRMTGVLRGVDVWGTGSGSIRYNRGSISSSAEQVKRQTGTGGTGQFDVFRDNTLTVAGSPEGATTAPVGTIAQRSDGAAGTALYVKESGSGNTGWRAMASAGADIQEFTASGTWTKPAGATTVEVILIAGGNGGGSGRRGASGTVCGGGGGGAGGAFWRHTFLAADLGSTEAVVVGAAGAGAAAVTTDNTNGAAGTMGGTTTFGASGRRVEAANCGSVAAGQGGTTAGGSGGWGPDAIGTNSFIGGGGSGGAGAAGVGVNSPVNGPAGGGGGGGISATPAAFAGGTSAVSRLAATSSGNGAGGAVDSTAPTSGTAPTFRGAPGQGPGGGAASITTAAQAGAAGTGYGSGGGGGGASLNGNASGAGGMGGPGYCLVITRF